MGSMHDSFGAHVVGSGTPALDNYDDAQCQPIWRVAFRGAAALLVFGAVPLLVAMTLETLWTFLFSGFEEFEFITGVSTFPVLYFMIFLVYGLVAGVVVAALGAPVLALVHWSAQRGFISTRLIVPIDRITLCLASWLPYLCLIVWFMSSYNSGASRLGLELIPSLIVIPVAAWFVAPWVAGVRTPKRTRNAVS